MSNEKRGWGLPQPGDGELESLRELGLQREQEKALRGMAQTLFKKLEGAYGNAKAVALLVTESDLGEPVILNWLERNREQWPSPAIRQNIYAVLQRLVRELPQRTPKPIQTQEIKVPDPVPQKKEIKRTEKRTTELTPKELEMLDNLKAAFGQSSFTPKQVAAQIGYTEVELWNLYKKGHLSTHKAKYRVR